MFFIVILKMRGKVTSIFIDNKQSIFTIHFYDHMRLKNFLKLGHS
jgi:hypothetical protein